MEKGGKGGSLLPTKTLKSSLKSSATKDVTGKDGSSDKLKRGRKIQFESEGSPEAINFSFKSAGKSDSFASKGGLNKGEKGDKVANGGKTSVPKEPQPLQLRVEQELPENAKCLMNCEAAEILQGIQEQMTFLSRDPTIKLPASFDKGLTYSKTGAHYKNPQSVRQVLGNLRKHGVSDGEICVLANVCPESFGEVFALVPSLKSKASTLREPLKEVIAELAKLKQSD